MLNTIGMSESIMKLIEKRNKMDMLILLALVIFTLVLIFVLFVYVKPYLFGGAVANSPLPSLEPTLSAVSYENI